MNIYLDIETIPTTRQEILDRVCADIGPPGNYKKPESIAQWWASEGYARKQEAIEKTALDGTWGEIICIGLAVNDLPVNVAARRSGEIDVLREFSASLLADIKDEASCHRDWEYHVTWIGHNVQDFDLRFLWQRCRINGVTLPCVLPLGKPNYSRGPWVYDTMKEWSGWKGWVKQTDLELAFGLKRNDPLKDGSEVHQAYQEGRIDDIVAHCRQDVALLRELHKRMAG